ncbi:ABC transporter [Klebsiella variicola]|nr:ABC transporter [Klebsiella variicola]
MLALVHMQEYAKRKPHQLSGGQRQRVALARSLAKRPKLLLLDEPMGALDKKLRDRMQLEVVDILERVGVTCVMVTHDQEEAMTMAGRIAIMNRGKFVQIGEPEEIYEHPTTRYSAEFIGSVNVFEGLVKERLEDGPGVEFARTGAPAGRSTPTRRWWTTCRSGWRCARRRSCCAMNHRRTATILPSAR